MGVCVCVCTCAFCIRWVYYIFALVLSIFVNKYSDIGLIDLNGMSNSVGLFYVYVRESHRLDIHFYSFCVALWVFCAHGSIGHKWFLNKSIWAIHGILTGTITRDQSRPGSNGKEVVLYTQNWSLAIRCSFIATLRIPLPSAGDTFSLF